MGESLNRGEVLAPAGPVRRRAPRQLAVRGVVRTVWQHLVPPDVSVVRVLPDAAVDLVFVGDRITVAGPDTTACVSRLPPGRPVLGFQLRPGAVSAVLGAPADALRDERVELAELWGQEGRDLEEAMVEAENTRAAADALEVALASRLGPTRTDPLPDHLVEQLRTGRPMAAGDLGLSERQTTIDAHLDSLAATQDGEGGFPITWEVWTPATGPEWRGAQTVERLKTLRAYGRI